MSEIAINVDSLSKRYRIGLVREKYTTLRDRINDGARRWFQQVRIRRAGKPTAGVSTIWALRNVSFDVKRGEVLGIIGRNGAGKTTLLKVLSRITEPTTGRAEVYGRIGSLLEVGTGFHMELTGRENIYLNGAILGMRKREIDHKFDEIVDFAEIGEFVDTPVKRYSSGMFVRLAFAIAAHLDTEILLMDEVLAVGDVRFQRKCLRKMGEVAGSGRTVLFVSHNMSAVLNLCHRAIVLESGRIGYQGDVGKAVDLYLSSDGRGQNLFSPAGARVHGDLRARIIDFRVSPDPPRTGMPVEFVFTILRADAAAGELPVELGVLISTEQGAKLMRLYTRDMGLAFSIPQGTVRVVARAESLPLAPGRYSVDLWLGSGSSAIHSLSDCFLLFVAPGRIGNGAYVGSSSHPVLVPSAWSTLE